jgi:predicted GNAT family N-acyltransferase
LFDGLTFKIASPLELSGALALRREVYTTELGHDGIDDADEVADHLVACDPAGDVVAALRIVQCHFRPFDVERIVTLSDFLPANRTPAEIARFCIRPDRRHIQKDHMLHVGMLKLAISFARKRGVTDFVTLALPRLRNLYRIAFFRDLRRTVHHPTWGTVHLMHLDLPSLEARCLHSSEPMARLLIGADPPNILV